jgi:hypothetical protein
MRDYAKAFSVFMVLFLVLPTLLVGYWYIAAYLTLLTLLTYLEVKNWKNTEGDPPAKPPSE